MNRGARYGLPNLKFIPTKRMARNILKVKVKVRTLDIVPRRSESPPQ